MNYYKKVQAARSEQEDVGGPDEEWKRLKGIKNKGRASFSQSERSDL
ncbi:hypothetical protein ABES33_13340 [Bacillus pseudomycoides]